MALLATEWIVLILVLFPLLDHYLREDRVYVFSLIYPQCLTQHLRACSLDEHVLNQSWLSGFLKQARKDWTCFRVLGWGAGKLVLGEEGLGEPSL